MAKPDPGVNQLTQKWVCPNNCGHSREDHVCHHADCKRGCHGHDGSDGHCDCPVKVHA